MIHVAGLPHTSFDAVQFSACAFTAKAVRLSQMFDMMNIEHHVYWGWSPRPQDTSIFSIDGMDRNFGENWQEKLIAIQWNDAVDYWASFNRACIELIHERIKPGDIVAVIGGSVQQSIVDAFRGDYTVIEPGVGYEGICQGTFACFESYAWKHNRYGKYDINDGRAYDVVIPNAIDPTQFEVADSKGYLLFIGRLIKRKGVEVAGLVADKLDMHLIVAGAGGTRVAGGIQCDDGSLIKANSITYAGVVNPEQRKFLLSRAEAFICPTLYVEPWGGVHIEAMASGVAVAAPDWGVFSETLPEDQRYNLLSEACSAVRVARSRRGQAQRDNVLAKYTLETCAIQYADWIDRLSGLRTGRDWYSY